VPGQKAGDSRFLEHHNENRKRFTENQKSPAFSAGLY